MLDELPFEVLVSGYGLTEGGTAAGTAPDDDPHTIATTVGRLRPSFELRLVHGAEGWSTTLITWPDREERRQEIPVTPRVAGETLEASVPLSSLPSIALAMQFGASAQVGDALVIDSCSSLVPG